MTGPSRLPPNGWHAAGPPAPMVSDGERVVEDDAPDPAPPPNRAERRAARRASRRVLKKGNRR